MIATLKLAETVAAMPFVSTAAQNSGQKRDGRLSSWKEIAGYLDRGVRTVQRWHAHLHLPVHKIGSGPRSPVFGYKQELDRWMRTFAGSSRPGGNGRGEELRRKEEWNRSLDLQQQWQASWFRFLLREVELASTVARTVTASADEGGKERVLHQVQRAYEMIQLKANRRHLDEAQVTELSQKLEMLRTRLGDRACPRQLDGSLEA